MKKQWESDIKSFAVIDVRKLSNNFLPGLLKKAKNTKVGEGLCVVQTFEPKPLYSALKDLGFEHVTEKLSDNEYRAYFYRVQEKGDKEGSGAKMPFKPTAILNYKFIDDELANDVMNLWELIWEKENAAIDTKTKLLLSLSNAVGARRFRQATRELIKAYAFGETVETFDELFSLFAWNQGVGFFSSEIGPSPLFGAYQLIKKGENTGLEREAILKQLMEQFGEKNPQVSTLFGKTDK